MKFSKILCLLLALVMVASVFVGCGPGEEEESTTKKKGGNTVNEQNEYDVALENLIDNCEVDMDGDDFYILSGSDIAERFNIDEPQDDVLNQAVYERNLAFNETFNAEISVMERDRMEEEFKATLSNDVRSSNEIHITFGKTSSTPNMITEGLLYNFLNLENIDLDAEWWDQGTKSFNIADSIWFMNGSSNVDDDLTTFILMFNTEMYDDLFPNEDKTLYEIVDDNDWTLAKFSEYIQSASADNGDNIWDENDTYGLVTTGDFGISIFYGSGLKYITCKEGEDPYISFDDNDKQIAINILEDVIPFYTNRYAYMNTDVAKPMTIFTGGRSLFYCEIIDYIVRYCNPLMEEDYGVLPVPKYDAKQDGYIGWTHAISSSMSIANNVTDPEEIGTLIEGYAILSQKYVTPAFYDKVLDHQSVRDEESSEMLRMVLANRTYDLAAYYTDMGLTGVFSGCFAGLNTNFESKWKRQLVSANKELEKLNKEFEKLAD